MDAGIIASPLGIIALEMRQDRNPVIGPPSYYFSPLPSFDGTNDRVQLLSGGYPLGVVASFSGSRWDARAGVTDGTPARSRKMMSSARPPARAQLVAGAGVSPVAGLRVGAGYAHGVYREPGLSTPQSAAGHATIFNVEAEYAIGHTRVAGEWIVDSFDTATTPAVARGYLVEAVQRMSPRRCRSCSSNAGGNSTPWKPESPGVGTIPAPVGLLLGDTRSSRPGHRPAK